MESRRNLLTNGLLSAAAAAVLFSGSPAKADFTGPKYQSASSEDEKKQREALGENIGSSGSGPQDATVFSDRDSLEPKDRSQMNQPLPSRGAQAERLSAFENAKGRSGPSSEAEVSSDVAIPSKSKMNQ
jgi:hypothetical protein